MKYALVYNKNEHPLKEAYNIIIVRDYDFEDFDFIKWM